MDGVFLLRASPDVNIRSGQGDFTEMVLGENWCLRMLNDL